MSLLSAVVVAIPIGLVLGGRIGNLTQVRLRWWGFVVAALAIQVVIFTTVLSVPAQLIPVLYVASNGLALVWVVRNIRVTGMPLFALGAASNLAAIVANGGRMPVEASLLARARGAAFEQAVASGRIPTNGTIADAHTRLPFLTDRFLLPPPFPVPTVFSVGDLLIAVGVAWLIVAAMQPAADQPAVEHAA
jgi:hypothetical protein